MAADFYHVSVLPEETVNGLLTDANGVYVDCTLGGAGHAARVVSRLSPEGRLVGIDQDASAVAVAKERLRGASPRIDIVHDNFRHLGHILRDLGITAINGALFDLGVSSYQIDTAERGFSYMKDAPLDMRMDSRSTLSAYEVVNDWSEAELLRIFQEYGEERWSKRIARFIAAARREKPVATTGELADIIRRAVPAAVRKAGGNPSKRVFQAIRIAVNDELAILEEAFHTAVRYLKPGGRIAIITFHSLEDRIAKNTLREMARGCICPPELPVCVCHHRPELRLLGRAIRPKAAEIAANPRAKSAKLRIAEKLSTAGNAAGLEGGT